MLLFAILSMVSMCEVLFVGACGATKLSVKPEIPGASESFLYPPPPLKEESRLTCLMELLGLFLIESDSWTF